ncbi:alpha/beta hydrolase [Desulfobulbus rhabdoformis]|uniref:alpha/beta hydrolase n=1 Tax=Desulfobulbus rhabdoformis TaxID=34032 RepID=UPI0019640659|nr:alpha/beta hydrolase [Desulfobulbus rhabdoformis]MBM9616969.1 alpha/beta hydrolase [Desulfobulbus rhabdoformis]
MKSINTQSISIPITQSSSNSRYTIGKLYGSGHMAVILSNMDTNDQHEWDVIIDDILSEGYMILTYDYFQHADDQSKTLEDAISFVCDSGVKKVILIGASRGGVASIKVAARHVNNDCIVGVVALSAPIEYEGTVFYSKNELSRIKIPKLLINSENDDGANDTRKMFELFDNPKEILFYPGHAHGTELFGKERESIIKKLQEFTAAAFEAFD